MIGAIINGITGLINSNLARRTSIENTDKTILANKQMAKYAYSKDLEMWERQNAYNTPEAQMERFKAAGLNPNLIYGQGSAGNATVIPKYQAPQQEYNYKPFEIPNMINMYQDVAMKQAQINNAKQLVRQNQAKADIDEVQRDWMFTKTMENYTQDGNKWTATMRPNWAQKFDYQLDAQRLLNQQKIQAIKNMVAQNSLQNQELKNKGIDFTIKKLNADWYEAMQKTSIGGKIGIPLLRLLLEK